MSEDGKNYEVGYGKPPLNTRFQPGHDRGNRKGRTKGNVNLKTDLQAELSEKITLTENGRKIRISKQRALVKSLVVKGIKGDDRAVAKAFDLLLRLVGVDDSDDDIAPLSAADQAILDAFLDREGGTNEPA